MKTRILLSSVFFSFFSGLFLFAQTPAPSPSPSPSPAPQEKKKETDFKTLVEKTLPQDIETASYYELVAWCRLLGIDDSGDKTVLVGRLKDNLKAAGTQGQKDIIRRIEIKSARSSEYFTLESIDENYVLLEGGVSIVLTDKKDNTQHTIKAERILYNQTKGTITASGNIEYTRQKGDRSEVFTGESFVFDVSNWEGVLYFAQGERLKKMEGQQILFRYSGEAVTRTKENAILLEKGTITSCTEEKNPHYRITADRIWVFAPGEWAIEGAVLYIGYIPVLYIPFFYYSSDELFFNPVIGFKPREGAFYQSTIYFIGKKKRDEGMFSFLQLEEANDQDYDMALRGLYLRPVKKENAPSSTPATLPSTIKHLKLMVDLYTRLGGFAGVSLDVTPAFKLYGGIGVSRSIFTDPVNGGYTPFYLGSDYWNSGNLFNLRTPFRFGLETDFNLSWSIFQRIQGGFYLFSDPFFAQDFYSRDENQDWGKALGFNMGTTQTTAQIISPTTLRTNLVWTLNMRINFAQLFNSPFFQTLQIDPFAFTFEWGSKQVTGWAVQPVAADPARMFYYPQRIIFPNFTLGVSGNIFQYTSSNEVSAEKQQPSAGTGGGDLLLPLGAKETAAEAGNQAETEDVLKKPDLKQDVPVQRTMKYFYTNESYVLSHFLKMEHIFYQERWDTADQINFLTKYSIFNYTGTSTINYQLSFWNSLFDISGNFSLFNKYQTTYDPATGYGQTIAHADQASTGLDLTNTFAFSYSPFLMYQDFKDTKISYNLKWNFYNIYYNPLETGYDERFLDFNRDTVSTQTITANLTFQPEDKQHYLKIITTIPPVLGSFYSELNFYLWIFQTNIVNNYKEQTNGVWYFEPLQVTERAVYENLFNLTAIFRDNFQPPSPIQPVKDIEGILYLLNYRYRDRDRYLFSQDLKYDFLISDVTKSSTTLDLWDLKATLLAQRMYPLSPLGTPGTTLEFRLYTLGISYYLSSQEVYLWKNRIAFTTGITTALNINFQKYVDSNFSLNLQFTLKVYQFLDITLKVDMYNNNVYRYIPAFVDAVNADFIATYPTYTITPIKPVNPLEDLLRSFNFFNVEDRYNSFFKLRSLGIDFVHYLDDWIFKVNFSGVFTFHTLSDGTQSYDWTPTVTFSLAWTGIPQIKRELTKDSTGMRF